MTAPTSPGRSVTLPGAARQGAVRWRLLVLGVILTVGSSGGFWMLLQSMDERQPVLVAARTIERFQRTTAADFSEIQANVGSAAVVSPAELDSVVGRRASGHIPAGTIVSRGLFRPMPMSQGEEAGMVLIEVSLPQSAAPFGMLTTGDRVALIGIDPQSQAIGESPLSLIGVLDLESVLDGKIIYVATPQRAKEINDLVDRFARAGDRRIWKIGTEVTEEELESLYPKPTLAEILADPGSGPEPLPGP